MFFNSHEIALIVVALISGIISPLTLKSKKLKQKHTFSKEESMQTDESIVKKLESIKEKYQSDRVWVAEFHNGAHTYSGKNFQKFSETYEVVNTGIATEAINTQDIPTSIFSSFFRKLSDCNSLYIKNVQENEDVLNLKSFLEARGIKSYIAIAIKDLRNNFVGIMCLDGVSKYLELEETDLQRLVYEASTLAGYLEI